MITTPGYFSTSMGSSVYTTAKSLVEEGDFALDKPTLETGVGKDGKYYVYEGLAFILVVTAVFGIVKFLGPHGFLLITNQILTALACLLIFLIGRELKYSKKTSILLSLIYGVATMAWAHSRYLMPEPFTTSVYLTSFLFLLKYKNRSEVKWLLLCGCFTGLALIVRPDAPLFVVAITVGILVLFYRDYREKNKGPTAILREGLIFLLPLFFFFAVYAYYNYARFGNIFELGYATKAQEVGEIKGDSKGIRIKGLGGTLLGFAGMWIIPCRSMFFINPVLIFIFWALKDFWKKYRFEFLIIGIAFVLHVLLYSNRGPVGFPGSSAWGIRYMVPMTAFMVIVIGIFVEKITKQRHRLSKAFLAIAVLSVLFQCIGASQSYQVTQGFLEEQHSTKVAKWSARRMMNLDPRWSLLAQNLKWIRQGLVDHMYYNYLFNQRLLHQSYLRGGDPPGWLGFVLFFYACAFFASGYLLFRTLRESSTEPVKKKLKGKKRRRRQVL